MNNKLTELKAKDQILPKNDHKEEQILDKILDDAKKLNNLFDTLPRLPRENK